MKPYRKESYCPSVCKMHRSESTHLLSPDNPPSKKSGLSVLFCIICIIDVFGVFPVVTLPKAVIDCGFYGILVVLVVCSMQIYTANLLGKCWVIAEKIDPNLHRKNRYPYSALAEITYGSTLSKFVTFLLDLTIFGGGIPNLIVASQNLQLLGVRISDNTFNLSYCYWIIIMGTILCPILWVGSPKDMKVLCSVSVVIVVSVFLLVNACLLFTSEDQAVPVQNPTDYQNPALWKTILITYGIIAFQFDIHPTILTIQVDMNEKNKLYSALLGGFGGTLCMFAVTTFISGLKFGQTVQPSILETLPTSIALHFAAVLVSLQLCLTSAVSNSALYQHLEDCLSISREFNHKRCILRTILTLLAIVIAESVPRFDLVMSLIGGTLTGPLVFILPPLFYIKMCRLQNKHHKQLAMESFTNIVYNAEEPSEDSIAKFRMERFEEDFDSKASWIFTNNVQFTLCIGIVIISCCVTTLTTFLNIVNAVAYANFTQPCIYNVSAALLYL